MKKTIFNLFKSVVKQNGFIDNYAEPTPLSGISHRIAGKSTNPNRKTKVDLTDGDKIAFRSGLRNLATECLDMAELPDDVLFERGGTDEG